MMSNRAMMRVVKAKQVLPMLKSKWPALLPLLASLFLSTAAMIAPASGQESDANGGEGDQCLSYEDQDPGDEAHSDPKTSYIPFAPFGIGPSQGPESAQASSSVPGSWWGTLTGIHLAKTMVQSVLQIYSSYYAGHTDRGEGESTYSSLDEALKNLVPEDLFLESVDIQKRSLDTIAQEGDEMIDERSPGDEGMKFYAPIAIDLPANPVVFVSYPEGGHQGMVENRPATFRGDKEGVGQIFRRLLEMAKQDPVLQNPEPRDLQGTLHKALISRIQGFDHPVVHRLFERLQEMCPNSTPLLSNTQDKGHLTFEIKEGKLLVKTTIEMQVRSMDEQFGDQRKKVPGNRRSPSPPQVPREYGRIQVERMMVFDLTTGEESQQLVRWQKAGDATGE